MDDLSARQRDVLDYIIAQITQRGIPPTYREIGDALGIASTNGVADHVKALIRKGYLVRVGGEASGVARGLSLTPRARSVRRGEYIIMDLHDEVGTHLGTHHVHRETLAPNRAAFAMQMANSTILSEVGDILVCAKFPPAVAPRTGASVLVRIGPGVHEVREWERGMQASDTETVLGEVFTVVRTITRPERRRRPADRVRRVEAPPVPTVPTVSAAV